MIRNIRIASIFILLLISTFQLQAQTATFSPYSRYGIGELLYNGYGWQRAMGGISIGSWNASHLNFMNPAGNTGDTVTIFEVGLNGEALNIANSTTSQNRLNGNISYLSMGFPLKKGKWYLSIGMLPLSTAGYNIQQTNSGTEPGKAEFYYQGDGGFNRYFASTGFKIAKGFWGGINTSYVYGTVNRTNRVEFTESGYVNSRMTNSITLSDFSFEGGLMYNKPLKNGNVLTLGLTFAPSLGINGKKNELWVNYYKGSTGSELKRDTIAFSDGVKGDITFPMQVGFGFSVSRENNWLIGFDAKYYQWEDLKIYGENAGLNNSMRIATGMQYIPDFKSMKYFNKVTYRIGAFYNSPKLTDPSSAMGGFFQIGKLSDKSALEVKTSDINEAGVNFGLGFPLRGKPYFSDLDLGFELSERGTIENNLVRERYFRIFLGLTFREEWFNKPKFD